MRIRTATLTALTASIFWTSQTIPKVWDDRELASFELPLAHPETSSKHVASDYYYRIPVRPIYRSYPIYAPGKEPAGYMQSLESKEPEIVFDPATLKSEAD